MFGYFRFSQGPLCEILKFPPKCISALDKLPLILTRHDQCARYPQSLGVLPEIFGLHFHVFDNNVLVKVASIGEPLVAHSAAVLHHISS